MDNQIETALCCSDSISQTSVTISDFSDEILLNILRFIPSHDLMLNVSHVCRKLRTLCLDKSLRAPVHLHKEYTVNLKTPRVSLLWHACKELKQTLLTPLYGVVPCCSTLRRLLLYLEASEGWREAGSCAQLMVGQSSVPHYQNLHWFSTRLAPGEVNRTLSALYLAVFSMIVPEGLMGLVLSVPVPAPPRPVAMMALMESMASTVGNTVSALQLPRTWLDGAILGQVLAHGCPTCLTVSCCSSPGFNPLHVLLSAGRDLTPLQGLNLRDCGRGPLAESCGKGEEEMDAESVKALTDCCPHLIHLNLSATHYHHALPAGQDGHLCSALGRLTALCSLALPVYSNTDNSSRSLLLGLKKSSRIGVPTYRTAAEVTVGQGEERQDRGLCIQPLLQGCPHLVELELIGAGFSSAMPWNEPAIRKDPAACSWSYNVRGGELLTLAYLSGVLKGTGLIELVQGCKDLCLLSLANLGSLKTTNYTQALLEALSYCTQLRDLRLEQPYFNANAGFFEALSQCHQLQRLCLVSRHWTFQPAAVVSFMQSCADAIMCHMFMGGTLVACKTLQKTLLDSFSITRPALSVVIYPLLHKDLAHVIRGIPLCHLDEITLFKIRVAEEPIK
uniref:F-box and leucine-rich repeat protein 18 n=1 Tax=Sinocyclocheilus grahami TaxID=75366 RepID=A0A672MAS1_SINGR